MKVKSLVYLLLGVSSLITSLSAGYYFVVYLPQKDNSAQQTRSALEVETPPISATPSPISASAEELGSEIRCRKANDLFLELKQLCGGSGDINQCSGETEVEIRKIENRESSLSVMSDEDLEKYGILRKLDELKTKLGRITSLKTSYLATKRQCPE